MIRDEDAQLTGYVYIDPATRLRRLRCTRAKRVLDQEVAPAAGLYAEVVGRV